MTKNFLLTLFGYHFVNFYLKVAYGFGNFYSKVAYGFGKFCIFASVIEVIMYKREIMAQLRGWAERKRRKPLVLRGARQVGKTTVVEEFGKEFDSFISLNLEKEDADIFRRYKNVGEVWQYVCLKHHITQDRDKRTLLFIDEIQEVPEAVAMLRYFYEELPWVYVIAAGSRLQVLTKKRISFPVGRVEYLTLRPFSFVEYLEAKGYADWAESVRDLKAHDILHKDLISEFNKYALIGGMPEAVSEYVETDDIERLSPIFNSLVKGYTEDVGKFVRKEEQARILQHILSTAWKSAAQTITFDKFGESRYSSRQIHGAMNILEKAYLLSLDYPVTSTSLPALPAKRRSPKLIMLDSGLTNYVAGIQLEYLQNKDMEDTWRGRAAEQIVAQELKPVLDRHFKEEQCFWVRDKNGSTAEVDFIWPSMTGIIPIEVKSGTNAHLRSIHSFVDNSRQHVVAVRVWSGGFSIQDLHTPAPENRPFKLINLPFYYVGQLDKVLDHIEMIPVE